MSETALPHVYSGKVRELYEVGVDRLLMVATDRVSVFDVVSPTRSPTRAECSTGLSHFWFDRTRDIVANHVISCDPTDFPETAGDVAGRAMLVRATRPVRARVRRARLSVRFGVEGVHRHGTVGGDPLPRRPARGRGAAPPGVHAHDEGRARRPRHAAYEPRRSSWSAASSTSRCATFRLRCTNTARPTPRTAG